MNETKDAQVLEFINSFTNNGTCLEIVKHFTDRCCYWFAYILRSRFSGEDTELMYDETMNHFGTLIDSKIYDITGDVTSDYGWVRFRDLKVTNPILTDQIKNYCINLD